MTTDTETRRRFERYGVTDTVFLTLRPQFEKMGKLKDISKSGVAFEYVALGDLRDPKTPDPGSIEVDIFSSSRNFYLSRVQCKLVYDIGSPNPFGYTYLEHRRCGLKFDHLSKQQHAQLGVLLDSCTSGEPLPYMANSCF